MRLVNNMDSFEVGPKKTKKTKQQRLVNTMERCNSWEKKKELEKKELQEANEARVM